MNKLRKVIAVPFDSAGNMIEGNFKDGIIGEASTISEATDIALSKGYKIADFETPDRVPGELIDDPLDAFAVSVITC